MSSWKYFQVFIYVFVNIVDFIYIYDEIKEICVVFDVI